MRQAISVLWLDDERDPYKYLCKKATDTGSTLYNNLTFYNDFLKKYNPTFIWVKNYSEFTNYITKNGLPDFISFDRDLKKGNGIGYEDKYENGEDCAKWLYNYCAENNKQIPKYYVHSANKNGRERIPLILKETMKIKITESSLNKIITEAIKHVTENVYMKGVNSAKKKIGLTYQKGNDSYSRGIVDPQDKVSTAKMDQNNADTYEYLLKGGIKSYNITSIDGTHVMHYFKNFFDKIKTTVQVKKQGGQVEDYQLQMENEEFNEFLNQFTTKVNNVISQAINEFKSENAEVNFNSVSIFPVPSSKRFNECMAQLMTKYKLGGLPTRVVNKNVLEKNLNTMKKDEDFIAKNSEFYNGQFSQKTEGPLAGTVIQHVDKVINQYKKIEKLGTYIERYNELLEKLLGRYANYKSRENSGPLALESIVTLYRRLYTNLMFISKSTEYEDPTSPKQVSKMNFDTFANRLKFTKGPSVENRSNEIWAFVSPYLRGVKCPVDGKPYKKMELVYLEKNDFKIKNISNGERMALKDIFSFNKDEKMVQKELSALKGNILVVFDDNLSGGSTLSDICYQFKKRGIDFIIPITFGKMAIKNQINFVPLSLPTNKNGVSGEFNY